MPVLQLIITVLLLAFFIFRLWQNQKSEPGLKRFFWPALTFKLVCGILVGLHYKGIDDTFEFQYAANHMIDYAVQNFKGYLRLLFKNDVTGFSAIRHIFFKPYTNSFFVSKLISILNFITGNNYYLNSLFFSLFSFAGCLTLVKAFSRNFPNSQAAGVIAFLFFPSVVFWSSGIMKESLLLGALGFFWAAILYLTYFPEKKTWQRITLLLISGWLLWKIRFFLAAVVFFLTGSWVVFRWVQQRFRLSQLQKFGLLFVPVCFGASVLLLIQNSGVFDLNYLFKHLYWDYNQLLKLSLNKTHIELSDFQPTAWSALKNAPFAVLSSFFRPFLGESFELVYLLAGLENLLILIIFCGTFFSLIKYGLSAPRTFFWLLLVYILLIAAILSLPTPNLGTLNRYRVAYLPFAIFLMLQTAFWHRLLLKLGLTGKNE